MESEKPKVGGVSAVDGSANSLEIDELARFAVDEHNKKQVKSLHLLLSIAHARFISIRTHLSVCFFVFIRFLLLKNALLQFGGVISAKQQVVSGTIYHITLEVKDGDAKKTYEAKVWTKPWMNFKELQEFKLVDPPSA